MSATWLPSDDENPEHLRHKRALPPARDTIYGAPARWYRIHVDYIPALLTLVDYYTYPDAHEGDQNQRDVSAGRWSELQYYLMTGVYIPGEGDEVTDNDFCEMVAACIDAGNLDQTILYRYGLPRVTPDPEAPVPDYPLAQTPVIDTCDKDQIYAACKQLVDWLDELVQQFLNKIATLTNMVELTSYWLDTFPLLSQLPFDEILEAFGDWLDELVHGYDASFTEDIKRDYYCGLFCIAQSTCSLNPAEIAQFFELQLGASIKDMSSYDMIQAILSLGTVGDYVVHSMFALITWCFTKGFDVLGIEPREFRAFVLAFTNDSDPDWAILCDECAENSLVDFQFTQSQYVIEPAPDNVGSFENGQGLTCYGHPETSTYGCQYLWNLSADKKVQKVEMVVYLKAGASATVTRPIWVKVFGHDDYGEKIENLKLSYGATREVTIEVFDVDDVFLIAFGARVGSTGGGSYVKIQHLKVWIEGSCEPEWLDFCAGN